MRLFIAINIPDEVKEGIAGVQKRLKSAPADVHWVRTDRLHLTLKFLGETDEARLDDLAAAVARSCAGLKPFRVSVGGVGAFPAPERPRVVWLGIREGAPELTAIAGRLDEELAPLGYEKERRPFTAHLTLGRVRSRRNLADLTKKMASLADAAAGAFEVTGVDVMRSILHPSGAEYQCLRSISV
jgi:2'-5' RNA ligase